MIRSWAYFGEGIPSQLLAAFAGFRQRDSRRPANWISTHNCAAFPAHVGSSAVRCAYMAGYHRIWALPLGCLSGAVYDFRDLETALSRQTSEITNKITCRMADGFLNGRAQVRGDSRADRSARLTAFPQLGTVQDWLHGYCSVLGLRWRQLDSWGLAGPWSPHCGCRGHGLGRRGVVAVSAVVVLLR